MENRIRVHIPVVPLIGDAIEFNGKTVAVSEGELSRLVVGENRFAVDADDGHIYEVVILQAGDGRRGSQRWTATGVVSRVEFEALSRSAAG